VPDSNGGAQKPVLLLDLGGVVLGIDFHRVFQHWAAASGVEASLFYDSWTLDQAYKDQEIGRIDFHQYTAHLSKTLGVSMSPEQWRDGWNALWTEPYNKVAATFGTLKRHFTLCAFSNTNAVHAESFMQRYPHILSQFDQLFLSHEVGCRKPSAEAFLHVCDLMRTKPQQVTFLDDSLENVAGARAAQLTAHHTRSEAEVLSVLGQL
jgi:HAD superfamily hydrolase (TIGR01509 family)